ncbi:hypothetical protein DFH27DRAFT_611396 [Peziza echinospora]|nr:hypothetical protein DFH27DRAFT_611396 [Peziza echinospora]
MPAGQTFLRILVLLLLLLYVPILSSTLLQQPVSSPDPSDHPLPATFLAEKMSPTHCLSKFPSGINYRERGWGGGWLVAAMLLVTLPIWDPEFRQWGSGLWSAVCHVVACMCALWLDQAPERRKMGRDMRAAERAAEEAAEERRVARMKAERKKHGSGALRNSDVLARICG